MPDHLPIVTLGSMADMSDPAPTDAAPTPSAPTPAAAAPGGAAGPPQNVSRPARGIIAVASVLLIVAIMATWIRAQIIDTEGWTQTSVRLLQSETIRTEISAELSERLLSVVNVQDLAAEKLPPVLKPLAPAISSAAASVVPQAVDRALQLPAVQTLWEQANRVAHERVMKILNGGGSVVSTGGGVVSVNLETLLNRIGQRLGVGGEIGKKLPPQRRIIVLFRSQQLKLAQSMVKLLKNLSLILPLIVILMYVGALALAAPARRRALLDIGIGIIAASLLSLVLRRWVESYVVHGVVHSQAARPAVAEVLSIATAGWRDRTLLVLVTGVLVLFAGWLAGPARLAIRARAHLAGPLERHQWLAVGCVVAVVLLIAAVGPARTPGQAIPLLIELALAVVGVLALRRQVISERAGPQE